MWKSNDKSVTIGLLRKKGLSLVELIIVTVVIAIAASMAFPTYTIFQQRSKEKRLKKILTDVRTAINGSKSHDSTASFEEGFRTVARLKGLNRIEYKANGSGWNNPATLPDSAKEVKQKCINRFIATFNEGYGYPKSPGDIWSPNPVAVFPGTLTGFCPGTVEDHTNIPEYDSLFNELTLGNIPLERPFYRNCDTSSGPVHPFHDWYPTANFEYVPVVDNTGNASGTTYTYDGWKANEDSLIGVKDIVSRGVGLALDGSNTNDW